MRTMGHLQTQSFSGDERLVDEDSAIHRVCGRLLPKNFRGPLSVWTLSHVDGDDPSPGAPDNSHAVEKDREISVLFASLLGSRSQSKNHSGGSCSAAREMGHDEPLINSVKTAFVWGTPA